MRGLPLLLVTALLACAGSSDTPEIPLAPRFQPPEEIPLRVGLRSDNSWASQLYGPTVIRDLKDMRLFEDLISPYNAHVRMDAKLRLFIERVETEEFDHVVFGLVDAGKPIRGAFAKPDPFLVVRLPVRGDVESGWFGTFKASNPNAVRARGRRLANALAQKIWDEREAVAEHLKKQEPEEPPR
jgi:hypothetical protein